MVVTDPPYLIETRGAGLYSDKAYVHDLKDIKDGFSENILDELCRVMKKINVYFFCSQKQILPLLHYFVEKKKCNYNILSWHKTNPIPACGNKYLTDTEFILFFREKGVRLFGSFDSKRTWYATPLNISDKKQFGHPTCKPIPILQNLITNSSQEGQLILDPFMGSGSTAVAAQSLNRNFIGFEINQDYWQKSLSRLQDLTLF